jgi:hypothetical protein
MTLSVGDAWPALDAAMPLGSPLYIPVGYRSDSPLRMQASAYAGGKPLERGEMMNAAPLHPAGSGTALVWVGYQSPAAVDEVRITVYDSAWKELKVIALPSGARWTASAAPVGERPAPLAALIAAESRLASASASSIGNSSGVVDTILGLAMMAGLPLYVAAQIAAPVFLRGRWRIASLMPLLAVAPAAVHAGLALAAGSNLWPIVILFAAPLAFLYLCGLFVLRFAMRGWRGLPAAGKPARRSVGLSRP